MSVILGRWALCWTELQRWWKGELPPARPSLLHLGYFSLSDAASVSILLAFLLQCPKWISWDYCPLPLCHQSHPPQPSSPLLLPHLLSSSIYLSFRSSFVFIHPLFPSGSLPFNQTHSISFSNILISQICSFTRGFLWTAPAEMFVP